MEGSLGRYKSYFVMTFLFGIVLVGTIIFLRRPEPQPITIMTATPRATPTLSMVVIDVRGAVAKPGLYTLPEGSRVQDALKSAGDKLSDADISALNLARKLNDGEQIYVPRISEVIATPSAPAASSTPRAASACISYKDANAHMNETTCVRGSVLSTTSSSTVFSIYFDDASDSFYAVSFRQKWDNLRGKCVEISGKIVPFRGRPEIVIDTLDQLTFCK